MQQLRGTDHHQLNVTEQGILGCSVTMNLHGSPPLVAAVGRPRLCGRFAVVDRRNRSGHGGVDSATSRCRPGTTHLHLPALSLR